MSDWRTDAIEAGARALLRPDVYGLTLEDAAEFAAAVVDAVAPIIRADERVKALEFCCADTEPDIRRAVAEEERERLRAQVEEELASPREIDEWTDGWNAAKRVVLALFKDGAQ